MMLFFCEITSSIECIKESHHACAADYLLYFVSLCFYGLAS